MSRKGNRWDNAPAERFFGRLEAEWVGRHPYRDRDDANRSIYFYIKMFYNSKRRHAASGYVSPNHYGKNTWPKRSKLGSLVSAIRRAPHNMTAVTTELSPKRARSR